MKKSILVIPLLLVFIFSACARSISKPPLDLMMNIEKSELQPIDKGNLKDQDINRQEEIIDFSLRLFCECFDGENLLISPLSIVSALNMVANGAKGSTLAEIEHVLNSDIQGLNDYLMAYFAYLPSAEKYKVGLANSIWIEDKEGLVINQDFLQINKDYYDADIYKMPFDNKAKMAINNWVKDKTKGKIKTILDQDPPFDSMMFLISALTFDGEWENIYEKDQIREGKFTLENGEKQTVEFMSSSEYTYLENEIATGFMKPYKDNKYAFVALLPKENISMSDLLESLDAKDIMNLIENKKHSMVYAKIPRFSVEYGRLLDEPLKALGILDAFDTSVADFTDLGRSADGNIGINYIVHKTRIDVDERGTKAGAATAVAMVDSAAPEEPKEVILNRPFFFMIIDTEQNLPLFMGGLMRVK